VSLLIGSLPVSDFGSRMGAADRVQVRPNEVIVTHTMPLNSPNVGCQVTCPLVCSVREEEAAGSNPATPTRKRQLRAGVLSGVAGPELAFWRVWRNPGEDLGIRLQDGRYSRAFSRPSRTATGDPGLIARRTSSASSHIAVSAAMSACRIPGVMWS